MADKYEYDYHVYRWFVHRCEIENSNFIASIFQYQKRIQDDPNQYLIVVTSKSQNQTYEDYRKSKIKN